MWILTYYFKSFSPVIAEVPGYGNRAFLILEVNYCEKRPRIRKLRGENEEERNYLQFRSKLREVL